MWLMLQILLDLELSLATSLPILLGECCLQILARHCLSSD